MKNKPEINTFLLKYYLLGFFSAMYFVGSFLMIIVNENIKNPFHITILLTMYSVIKVIFEIPSGAFADRFGRKNTMILASIFGIIGFTFFLLRENYWYFVLFYAFLGLSDTFDSGAFSALMYDNMKELGIEKNYAKYRSTKIAICSATFSLSSFAASYMISFGYNFVIIVTIFTAFICNLFVRLTIEDTNKTNKNITKLNDNYWKILKKGFIYSFKHKTILKFMLFAVSMYSVSFVLDNYYELILFHITNNINLVPILIAIGSGIGAIVRFIVPKYIQHKNSYKIILLLLVSYICFCIAFIYYAFPITFILTTTAWIFYSICSIILNAKKQCLIPSKIRATVESVEGFLFGLVSSLYLLSFGLFVKITSYKIGFLGISVVSTVVAIIFFFVLGFDRHLRKKESRLHC